MQECRGSIKDRMLQNPLCMPASLCASSHQLAAIPAPGCYCRSLHICLTSNCTDRKHLLVSLSPCLLDPEQSDQLGARPRVFAALPCLARCQPWHSRRLRRRAHERTKPVSSFAFSTPDTIIFRAACTTCICCFSFRDPPGIPAANAFALWACVYACVFDWLRYPVCRPSWNVVGSQNVQVHCDCIFRSKRLY